MRILFAGPTLAEDFDEIKTNDPELIIRRPTVWGDVANAVMDGAEVIGIVDGCFEHNRAVWHKEILYALSKGVVVAGAASMGALRAAECAPFGMIGIGQIFEGYMTGELIDDSEVALIHASEEFNYHPLSEPRVNVMATLKEMHRTKLISEFEWRSAETAARRTHYAELNFPNIFNRLPITDLHRLQRLIAWATEHRVNVKKADAMKLVDWIRTATSESGLPVEWQFGETSQWRTLMSEVQTVRMR